MPDPRSDPGAAAGGSPWLTGIMPRSTSGFTWTEAAGDARPFSPPLVRDHGLGTAIGLLARSLPFALARFGVTLGCAAGGVLWLAVTLGGAAWLGLHVAPAFGWAWLLLGLFGAGWFWISVLRFTLHLLECGHVAVLTELITRGEVGDGGETMFSHGRRVVLSRFGEATLLFGLNALVRGTIETFHRTLDWTGEALPIPGLEALAGLATMVLRAAGRPLDKVVFSYILARGGQDSWAAARDGIVYCGQNAAPILRLSAWIVVLERVLSVLLWLLLLASAAATTLALPPAAREAGGILAVTGALSLAWTLRACFVKPLFLIMVLVRFHALIEHQPVNAAWSSRLSQISDGFRTLGRGQAPGWPPA